MDLNATNRQLLLQFLKTTGGVITRVLDFWFGVWDPEARAMFRSIYRGSPEFARLPPTDKGHEETYCLRVTVCNRPTDEHRDHLDIKRDMTGLMQIEEFEGIYRDSSHTTINGCQGLTLQARQCVSTNSALRSKATRMVPSFSSAARICTIISRNGQVIVDTLSITQHISL